MEWVYFHIALLVCLYIDLNISKKSVMTFKKSLAWSAFWVGLGLAYGVYIFYSKGQGAALEYYTAYTVEKSLSIDNLFVFAIIFTRFSINTKSQHKLLIWGILGAIILRGIMIYFGSILISQFHFIFYIFGAFLIYTGIQFIRDDEDDYDPKKSKWFQWIAKYLPLSEKEHHGQFTVKNEKGKTLFTNMFLALIVIEISDLVFAIDSIPAVFGITQDPFIVYTSNVAAILGLRSLYFVLENLISKFHFLKYALGGILILVGIKMLFEKFFHVHPLIFLGIILLFILTSVLLSLKYPQKEKIPGK